MKETRKPGEVFRVVNIHIKLKKDIKQLNRGKSLSLKMGYIQLFNAQNAQEQISKTENQTSVDINQKKEQERTPASIDSGNYEL